MFFYWIHCFWLRNWHLPIPGNRAVSERELKFGEVFVDGYPENLVGHVESCHLHDGSSEHGGHNTPPVTRIGQPLMSPSSPKARKGVKTISL